MSGYLAHQPLDVPTLETNSVGPLAVEDNVQMRKITKSSNFHHRSPRLQDGQAAAARVDKYRDGVTEH